MGKKRDAQKKNAVFISYEQLGTISIDELAQAVYTDIQALKDIYNVKYVTAPQIKIPITNEYGDERLIHHPEGHHINRMDTHHYKPACKDYEL